MFGFSRIRALFLAGLAVALPAAVLPAAPAAASQPAPYYLALGDSLSQGVQPTASGVSVRTNQGYVDDLYAFYRERIPGLRLKKLGCPGETTGTMMGGGICPYADGNQLAQAVSFLASHRVAFMTIDIGANNVDGCVSGTTVDTTCVSDGIEAAGTDLAQILGTLRTAAPGVPIVGMNYYDPFLAEWLLGPVGQAVATQSIALATGFNSVLDGVYAQFGVPVADVQDSFQTTNTATVAFLGEPVDVALICAWTWMCAPPPQGPNIHANRFGYAVIAWTFVNEMRAAGVQASVLADARSARHAFR